MRPRFECLKCILTVRLREIENTNASVEAKIRVTKELLKLLVNEFSLNAELTRLATNTFKLVVSMLPEVTDYYSKVKQTSNLLALQDLARHESRIAEFRDNYEKFKYLVKLSGIANTIDYGVAEHEIGEKRIDPEVVEKTELYIDHTRELYEVLRKGVFRVLWLFDNAGEAVYDLLLIREIKLMGNTVIGLVKKDPGFQNDMSLQDAVSCGLTSVLNGLLSYNGSTVHVDNLSEEVLRSIEKADLVVAKGMAHYEYLSEYPLGKPTVFILIPKCDPVASTLGAGSKGRVVCVFRRGVL